MTTSTPKTPDQMSVSELRGWLSSFGKQQQDHYHQTQPRRRSPIKTGRLSVRQRILGLEQPRDDVSSEGENNSQQENNKPGTRPTLRRASSFTKPDPTVGPENESPSTSNRNITTTRSKPMFALPRIESGKLYPGTASSSTSQEAIDSVESSFANAPKDISFLNNASTSDSSKGKELDNSNTILADLPLVLSALTTVSSSSSVEVEASESICEDKATEVVEPFEAKDLNDIEFNPKSFVRVTKLPTQKALPDAFSDFEPIDFEASASEASSFDDSDKNDVKNDHIVAENWPAWNGDAHQFLKHQSHPSLQGYWSDHEDALEEEDGDTVATGLRTEPCFGYGNARITRKQNRRREPKFREPGQFEEEFKSAFTLFDAAQASVAGTKPRTRGKSLSEHFGENKKKASRKTRESHSPSNESFHSANLFQDKTLTASTLDVICNEKGRRTSNYQSTSKLESFIQNGGHGSVSSASVSEDSGRPSVAPGAVDEKLSKHFNLNNSNSNSFVEQRQDQNTKFVETETREEAPMSGRKHPEPRGESNVNDDKSDGSGKNNTWVSSFPPATVTTKSVPSKKYDEEVSPSGSFSSVIEKFGGSGSGPKARRMTHIQRQKEALEQQWAAERKPKHVKKTKWAVCRSSGTYKKKVVLDFE